APTRRVGPRGRPGRRPWRRSRKADRPRSAPTTVPGTEDATMTGMAISLGPLQYFWPRARTLAFYREVAGWPVDVVCLGETVCGKRRELRTAEWIDLA